MAGATESRGASRLVRTHLVLATLELLYGAALGALVAASLGPAYGALGAGLAVFALVDLVRAVRARRAAPETALSLRFGATSGAWVVAALLQIAVGPVAFVLHTLPRAAALLGAGAAEGDESGIPVALVFALALTLAIGCSGLVVSRASRVAQGTPGAVRLAVGAVASFLVGVAQLIFGLVVYFASHDRVSFELDFALSEPESSPVAAYLQTVEAVASAQGLLGLLYAAYALAIGGALVMVGALISTWFLVPLRVRRGVFLVVDGLALLAFVFALYALPFVPPPEHPDAWQLPALALSITTIFVIRAVLRAMPGILDTIELTGFRALVAARMLRAKKSGFLTVIGFLSILAVSFSSCTLSTTLSVMGGFRADLQQKILGNHAHVVVDREYGNFDGWDVAMAHVRDVEDVTGVTPYVSGEVMITSASSLAGAELRGIDPRTIGDVTDLPRNMRHGRLDYLSHPERLLHLSADEMSGSLLLPELLGVDEETGDAEPPTPLERVAPAGSPEAHDEESLEHEIDDLLRAIDRRQAEQAQIEPLSGATDPSAARRAEIEAEIDDFLLPEEEAPSPPATATPPPPDVLPGLIVGQELARTLRLHVGDEVNVVSPNGELGPAGLVPRTQSFRVAGIFYSGMYEYDMQMAYTDLATAQRFLEAGDEISGLEIHVEDWEHAEDVADRVRASISRDDLRVRSWQEVNRNLFGALALEKLAMFITLGIAILVASFCVVGTLTLMVQEKGREVAILKAMGAEDRTMVGMFLLQGLFIGLVGALSGLGLGYVVCFALEHFGLAMNPEVYYIDRLPVHIDAVEFASVGLAAVGVCLLATIYPAILGSRLRPVDALRDR
ncbi:MAG: ABC transporter permease [Sandaracinus sp.]